MSRRGLFTVSLLLAPQILAQTNPAPATELETVIVSASRTERPSVELAAAWSRLDQDSVDFTLLQHSNQLMQRVAGAWVSRNNGQESLISLRSPVLTGAGSCGAFITAEDSISLRAPGFCNVNQLFDANLAQAGAVEVLRGPDSGVYGSNAMYGVINVLSRSADQTQNRVQLESGSRDFYRTRLELGSSETGLAFNLQASSYGGYQDASGYDQQKFTGRWDGDVGEWQTTALVSASNLNQETAGYIEGFERYESDAARRENPNPEAYRDAWSARGYLRSERALSGGRQLSLTVYARDNNMTFLQHFLPWQATETTGHSSLGVQSALSGSTAGLDWRGGIDIDGTRGWLREFQEEPFSPNQPEGQHYDYEVDAVVSSIWAQASKALSAGWRLNAALRLEHTDYDYDNRLTPGSACDATASACRFFRPADRKDRFSNWSGNIGVVRTLDDQQFYARIARGYRAPQTTELYRLQGGQLTADIDPESMTGFELGSRGRLTPSLSYALNGYWMTKRDVIFQSADRFNVNGADTAHRGIELEADWQISAVWSAGIAATLARHTYESSVTLLGARTDIEGNDIDTAPRHFGSARLVGDFHEQGVPLVTELELTWVDEYFLEPDNQHRYAGHQLVNWRSDYTVSDRLSLNLVVTNVTDEGYAERADFGFGSYRYFVGEPRSVLLGVAWNL
ncbi:MAG: TonB-dependent receptor [Halieaceae bacterium]|jgi:outer membrane receptor protein involved in Fe transport|nr:TonB-dependent receptor [Halieaceae bacterium]